MSNALLQAKVPLVTNLISFSVRVSMISSARLYKMWTAIEIGRGNPRVKKLYPYPYPPKPLPPIKGRGFGGVGVGV